MLGAYWRYRVGDCRVICDIQDGVLCILVIEIGNRDKFTDECHERSGAAYSGDRDR
jgi:mRNA-degrading endonuclease RelE of RelBE toxin-antitoxin system